MFLFGYHLVPAMKNRVALSMLGLLCAGILQVFNCIAGGGESAGNSLEKSPSRPNILFILVDDYGIKDVGIEGKRVLWRPPNIDALARSGMWFTQGYAACSVCSPSRASILLGQYTTRHGITDYIGAAVGKTFATRSGVH